MNKKIALLPLLFLGLLFANSLLFGDVPGVKTTKVMASISFVYNIQVNHTHIERISPYQNEANFVVVGSCADSSVTHMEIEYYVNNDTNTKTMLPLEEVCTPFESTKLTVPSSATSFSYRFVIVANNNTADKKYYPYDSNTWIHVPIVDSSTQIIGASGGSMSLEHGDQRYFCSKIVISPNALSSDRVVKMTESDMNSFSGDKTDLIKLYEIDTIHNLTQNAQITLYYGSSAEGKFIVKYLNGNTWQKVKSNQTQNTLNRTVSFESKEKGYYGIFIKTDEQDGSYRPEYRVFRVGDKLTFGNLQAGDTVTILDINGRQIKKLTTPPFEWDGRKDNGSYAESGSYIYQIKVNGKVVSGSIAFIK